MKKIILIASITLSLTSCMGLHTYKMQSINPFTAKVNTLSEIVTVSDWANFKAGQIIPEGVEGRSAYMIIEVIK